MTRYRGGAGMWAWIMHRLTGVGVMLFLITHVIDTALVMWGPKVYNSVIQFYRLPVFKVAEIFLFAAVLYHALNGLRIVLVDFWPELGVWQRQLFYAVMALFVAGMVPVTIIMVGHLL